MTTAWKIVGISGTTCSGKSSLVKFLVDKFPGSVSLCQDTYFLDKTSDKHVMVPELNHQNWERLEALDWDSMMLKIRDILNSPPPNNNQDAIFFVEGHIIYNYPPLNSLFHRKYFLTLDKEECFRRRSGRVYDPPDPPGYFDMIVWPMYLSNKAEMEKLDTSVVYVDGSLQMNEIHNFVYRDIKTHLFQ